MGHEAMVKTSDGAQLWTTVDGNGPPVVLCHGGPGLWDYLGDLAALLSDEFTVCRWDQRACGRSTAGAAQPSMKQTIEDLEALRTYFGHDRWSVVGHSWGAEVALFSALLHPASVDRFAYISGRGPQCWWRSAGRAECASRTARRINPEQSDRLAALAELEQRDAAEEAEFRFLSWMTDFNEPEASPALEAMVRSPLAVNFAVNRALSSDEPIAGDALRSACEQLDRPALFVHGEDDPRPAQGAMLLASWFRRSSARILPGAAHFPWVEQPSTVGALLKSFLHESWSTASSPPLAARGPGLTRGRPAS